MPVQGITLPGDDRPSVATIYGYCGSCGTSIHERTERTERGVLLCATCWSVRLAHPDPEPARAYGPPAPRVRRPRRRWATDRATGERFDYVIPDMDTVEPWLRGGIMLKRPGTRGQLYAEPAQRKNPTVLPKGAAASNRRRVKSARTNRALSTSPVERDVLKAAKPRRARKPRPMAKTRARTMHPDAIGSVVARVKAARE